MILHVDGWAIPLAGGQPLTIVLEIPAGGGRLGPVRIATRGGPLDIVTAGPEPAIHICYPNVRSIRWEGAELVADPPGGGEGGGTW